MKDDLIKVFHKNTQVAAQKSDLRVSSVLLIFHLKRVKRFDEFLFLV